MVFTNCGKQATRVTLFLETQFVPMKIFKISFFFLALTVFQFSDANAQSLSSPDSSNYDKLTADVYKALKSENRKFLEPHIFDLNTFKEIILEISKEMRNLDMDYKTIQQNLEKELNDPARTAEWTEKLNQNVQEKYHRSLADIADYGFDMQASKYIGHSIDPDREGNFWTYDIQFKMADKKDTLIVKLKSCIHYDKKWYLTEGIKVKRYHKPVQQQPQIEVKSYEYEYQIGEESLDIPPPPVEENPHEISIANDYDIAAPVEEPYYRNESDTNALLGFVEEPAQYLGTDLRTEISQKLVYPQYEKENGIEGNVYVEMIVERNGTTTEHKVLRSVPGANNFNKEAIDVLKRLDYAFKPARHNGKVVRSKYIVPIKFVLK
jgi:TonB family protein